MKTVIEKIDDIIDYFPDTKEIIMKSTKDEVCKVKKAIKDESKTSSYGKFESDFPKNVYAINYRGVNIIFKF